MLYMQHKCVELKNSQEKILSFASKAHFYRSDLKFLDN